MSYDPGAVPADMIPLSVPVIGGNEWQYIKECLDTGWVSSVGSYVTSFEKELAAYVGAQYAIATVNGTSALHIALMVAGVQAEDLVLMPTLTFIAPAYAVRYCGAYPIFLDVDPFTWELSIPHLEQFITQECQWDGHELRTKTGHLRVKAILPVHILGQPVDMDGLLALARHYNLMVVEDATESLGSRYKGRSTGILGDLGCFSFNGNKIITTGGGGMVVTNNEAWAARVRYLTTQAKDDSLEYIHGEVGYNYRLTNLQAAMGCAQMEQLNDFVAKKRAIAERYTTAFASNASIIPQGIAPWAETNHWLYTIRLHDFGLDSRALLKQMTAAKIMTRPLWQPMHQSPVFQANPVKLPCPTAEGIHAEALSLPSTPNLTEEQQDYVIETICQAEKMA